MLTDAASCADQPGGCRQAPSCGGVFGDIAGALPILLVLPARLSGKTLEVTFGNKHELLIADLYRLHSHSRTPGTTVTRPL